MPNFEFWILNIKYYVSYPTPQNNFETEIRGLFVNVVFVWPMRNLSSQSKVNTKKSLQIFDIQNSALEQLPHLLSFRPMAWQQKDFKKVKENQMEYILTCLLSFYKGIIEMFPTLCFAFICPNGRVQTVIYSTLKVLIEKQC